MHITKVKFKDGSELEGELWDFNPREGTFSFVDEDKVYYFRDVESMITKGARISINEIGDRDELERVRKDG